MLAARREELVHFMNERETVRLKKERGSPKPWTTDWILRDYRFCNVRREDDKVTRWVSSAISQEFEGDPSLWFMLCIARQINLPETLQEMIMPAKDGNNFAWPRINRWEWQKARKVMLDLSKHGQKIYTSAYMLTCVWPKDHDGPTDKPYYTCRYVLQPVWEARRRFENLLKQPGGCTLREFTEFLASFNGWGRFTAAQVTADLKFTSVLRGAKDWKTYAASGPGSRRGLNRIYGHPVDTHWREEEWLDGINELQAWLKSKKWDLCAQNVQNCLCEFDKYSRLKYEEGRVKSKYNGRA